MAEHARREASSPDNSWNGAEGADPVSPAHPSRDTLLRDGAALAAYLGPLLVPPPLETNTSAEADQERPVTRAMREAATLAAIYARDGAPWLIFTRRAATLSRHKGEISFPGGKRDGTDPTLAFTALRESREEIALDPARVRLLGALPSVYFSISDYAVTTFIGWMGEGEPALTPAHGEVAEIIRAPLLALDDPAIYHEELWTRGDVTHTVMFYDFGRHRIWGLTGGLLHHLLSLLPPRA